MFSPTTNIGAQPIKFGPFEVTNQVFLKTDHSFAVVNLKPLLPGHILVCPLQPHRRLADLTPAETGDLFTTAQLTQKLLGRAYFPAPHDATAGSFTVAVQDGPESGQTVPHVHVHVIPRTKGDMEQPDEIYGGLASEDGNVGGALWDKMQRPKPGGSMPKIEDADRKARTEEVMMEEAEGFKAKLREMGIE
ncbi:HIT-like domain-containing protein [Emericellopsis atlantica]|uniref:Bis(5'-adenosyl)-triphosphatase n=1 Tax=Emericellopsis atlantica TaxID=2614577 RepID=A0A9P7ZVF7_9HYPO|nr:HIT-like domain-containing protein [Emericellopsis atlantica]KAG9258955.1 HIT-like domain-containing protein [Emericellopsis atlantica]